MLEPKSNPQTDGSEYRRNLHASTDAEAVVSDGSKEESCTKVLQHAPGPWEWRNVAGAGLEIFAPVHLVDAVELPKGIPPEPINISGMTEPQNILIAYERWVQFEPVGWHDMQVANVRLMASAPELLAALNGLLESAPPAFRNKPIGAPGSQARIEQDAHIAAEDAARAAIQKATHD